MDNYQEDVFHSEKKFIEFIETIDGELRLERVPIHRRPLDAIREVCLRYRIELGIVSRSPSIPGVYRGDSLVAHIHEWYQKRYGDRLKINFSPGSAAVFIKEDHWKIDFPLIYGKVKLVFEPNLDKYENMVLTVNGPLYANPLRSIKGFTSDIAKSLSKEEMIKLSQFFIFSLYAIQTLREIKSKPFIPEARADLRAAVENLFLNQPQYGQSKWASLQFAEKLLKCFLKNKKVCFPRNHNIAELSELASQIGLPAISRDVISAIQCPAGVRYGEINVSLDEAIEAHHASLIICSTIVDEVKSKSSLANRVYKPISALTPGIEEGNFYNYPKFSYFYYCEKIEGDTIHWILLESYQHGNLIQVEFSQFIKDATGYVLVTDQHNIIRLIMMLKNYYQK